MQMVFRLKMKLQSQVLWHVPACGGYQRMAQPVPLKARLLTLLLPSPVALEVTPVISFERPQGVPQGHYMGVDICPAYHGRR